MEIKESCPDVSYALAYWSLTRVGNFECDRWKYVQKLYDTGWIGITLCNISDFEEAKINKFLRKISGNYFKQSSRYESDVEFNSLSLSIWFKNLEDHNNFVVMLEALPIRDKRTPLLDIIDLSGIKKVLKGKNFTVVKMIYNIGCMVSSSEYLTDFDMVMIKMFCC